jgi:cytochrome c oxidase cbb3-type subunit 3
VTTSEINITTGAGDFDSGQSIFHYKCARCHGSNGMGGIGPAILNADFIRSADQIYIINTLRSGHGQTPMHQFDESIENLEDLLTFMTVIADSIPLFIDPGPSLGNPESGKDLFQKYCAECHGKNGEGIEAPSLNNQEFLNAASNGYLLATITIGRSDTPMPAWGYPSPDRDILSGRERHHLVSYIRHWQTLRIKRDKDDPIFDLNKNR